MADEIVYKKMTRKADRGLEGKVVAKHGKQTNQKLKPYVVLEYLMKYSDENNTKSAYDIIGYLENCGISAERRSIYRDIEDINRIMLMLQEDIDLDEVDMMFEEAAESGDEEDVNELKTILYDKNKKGFYVRQRKFEVADMRLLAECVYSSKFIAEGQAKRLVDVICEFVSEEQARKIKHNVQYAKVDDTHFSVTAKVEISEQFFGWILGFGSKAKLVYPEDVMTEFSGYLDRIREMY